MTRTLFVSILAATMASGCVAKKKYVALEDQLTATQAELAEAIGDEAAAERRAVQLAFDVDELQATNEEMYTALQHYRAREKAAVKRTQQYRQLVAQFQDMIDAGTLHVKIVDNRMVLEIGTDILFPSGSAELSAEGKATAKQVGDILAAMDRKFQVEGHTDNVPISTKTYPSNYELAAARSIAVMRTLMDAGLSGDQVSAASFADTRPVASNANPQGKAHNRRVEIVLEPDLSLLPPLDQIDAVTSSRDTDG